MDVHTGNAIEDSVALPIGRDLRAYMYIENYCQWICWDTYDAHAGMVMEMCTHVMS